MACISPLEGLTTTVSVDWIKNFIKVYTDAGNVNFTPVYDMVTTQAYSRYADNPPALTIDGRRTWAPGNTLSRFYYGSSAFHTAWTSGNI